MQASTVQQPGRLLRGGSAAEQAAPEGGISEGASPPDALSSLIAASAQGDEQAFRRLYGATSDAMFGMALRILGRRDWAEEVLQESFVRVWRHAARFDRSKGAAMTWLLRIVRNQALDWMSPSGADGFERQHGLAVEDLDQILVDDAASGAPRQPAEIFEGARRADDIAACLARLDAQQRQSIMLVFFHGLSHGDLAGHLQRPLGTVKAWVRRGLQSLRSCLAALEPL